MSTFRLFDLPEELAIIVTTYMGVRDLAKFCQTAWNSNRLGQLELYSNLSHEETRYIFQWAYNRQQPEAAFPVIHRYSDTLSEHPSLAFDAMHLACRFGHAPLTTALLDAGVPPERMETTDSSGRRDSFSPLDVAATHGHADVMDALLTGGVDLNKRRFLDNYALLCGKRNSVSVRRVLLNHGFDIHQVDEDGDNFLHYVCRHGKAPLPEIIRIIEVLLQLGLDINQPNADGDLPLMLALMSQSIGAVRFLVSKGADVNAVDAIGLWPLELAMQLPGDQDEKIYCLLKGGATIDEDSGLQLLRLGLSHEIRVHSLALLVRAWKTQVATFKCKDPNVLFCAAAAVGDVELLGQVLQHNPGTLNADCIVAGTTALTAAAASGHTEVIKFLIPHITSYNHLNPDGRTALHVAILSGSEEAVRLLLPHSPIGNADTTKRSPLLSAIGYQPPTIVAMLLDRLVNGETGTVETTLLLPLDKTHRGPKKLSPQDHVEAALQLAVLTENAPIVRLLLRRTPGLVQAQRRNPRLLQSALPHAEDVAVALITWGVDVSGTHTNGHSLQTALWDSVGHGRVEIVRALQRSGQFSHMPVYEGRRYRERAEAAAAHLGVRFPKDVLDWFSAPRAGQSGYGTGRRR
ncbi:ankyrin repeat domain-containing protein [Aspergillus mulundensis]|uniref:Uncharacterized protein n=1 Tax=Aspergillus mulundensis TaxID=1810919 RepID=A0A3D8S5S5_9EURO|nr:hypothetical protein DSM5745_05163 [Aspergillus mulundensis]RDW81606.1 hypothetical protein DSM5745_05163 [Aspergillus mulundensis]